MIKTIGELKALIANLPDNTPILRDVEDNVVLGRKMEIEQVGIDDTAYVALYIND